MEDQKIKKPKDPKYKNTPEYNKKYYASHKTEILLSLKTKCECPDCGRIVSYSRLKLHRKTDYCLNNRKTDLTKMKEQVEKLTKLLEEKEDN
jgi:hypothetical protein